VFARSIDLAGTQVQRVPREKAGAGASVMAEPRAEQRRFLKIVINSRPPNR
jgi:hypothetical protein